MLKKITMGVIALTLLGLTACGASCDDCATLEDGETCTSRKLDEVKDDAADAKDEAIDDAKNALDGLKSDG